MFKRILQISMLIAVFGLMIPSLSYSKQNMEAMKELRQKIKDYKHDNIVPKLNDWKKEIDKNLKKDDLDKLNILRNKVAETRKLKRDEMKAIAENTSLDKSDKKDQMKETGKSIRKDMKDIGSEIKPIAMNNIDFLKKLGETAKPFAEKWQTDIKKIRDDWKAKNNADIEKGGKGNRGDFPLKGFDGLGDKNDKDKGKRFIAMVMLYNGESDYDEEDLFGPELMKEFNQQAPSESDVKISPNPFSENAKISFDLNKTSKVTLNITDQAGRKVADLFNGNLGAGNQEFEFKPAANSSNGIYFYNLTIDGKVLTGKIMYSK